MKDLKVEIGQYVISKSVKGYQEVTVEIIVSPHCACVHVEEFMDEILLDPLSEA